MRVLVGCEFSGVVRRAFRDRGHDAWSCDLLPAEDGSAFHLQCDLLSILGDSWDLLIAHPPCTHLAVSGAQWFPTKIREQREALEFALALFNAPVPMRCIENPVGVMSTLIAPADQTIQPWMFGDEAQKRTCLWLKNLPRLRPTRVVGRGRMHVTRGGRVIPVWYNLSPSEDRGRERSRTFPGTAAAMAAQWGAPHRTGFGFYDRLHIRKKS